MAYAEKEMQIKDPTALILVDEADRLRMASLEQVRAIFDAGEIGVILIGMPGPWKRLARYPQFYSRIGFVHEFRPLAADEIRQLLDQGWMPSGVNLPNQPWDPETVAMLIRMTGGNFRLLNRLLTQIERVLEINALREVTMAAVEVARQSLVIGEAWSRKPSLVGGPTAGSCEPEVLFDPLQPRDGTPCPKGEVREKWVTQSAMVWLRSRWREALLVIFTW
jgi:hypothetical protein